MRRRTLPPLLLMAGLFILCFAAGAAAYFLTRGDSGTGTQEITATCRVTGKDRSASAQGNDYRVYTTSEQDGPECGLLRLGVSASTQDVDNAALYGRFEEGKAYRVTYVEVTEGPSPAGRYVKDVELAS